MKLVVKYIVEIDGQIKEVKNIVEVDLPYGQIDQDDSRKINPETSNDLLSVMSRGNIYTGDDIEFEKLTKEIESQKIVPDLKIGRCKNGHILRAEYGTTDYFHLFNEDNDWWELLETKWNERYDGASFVRGDYSTPTFDCLPSNEFLCSTCGCDEYWLLKDLLKDGFDAKVYNEVSLDMIDGDCLNFHNYDSAISDPKYLDEVNSEIQLYVRNARERAKKERGNNDNKK